MSQQNPNPVLPHAEQFEAIHRDHAPRVRAYFLRSGFAAHDAEDLAQEVFVRAFGYLATFDSSKGSMAAWLAGIARNVARRQWARRAAPDSFDPELAEQMLRGGEDPADSSQAREEIDAVRSCVQALPAELAEAVRLRYVQGLTTRGMAGRLEMPEATVRLRLAQARQMLEQCLRGKGILP